MTVARLWRGPWACKLRWAATAITGRRQECCNSCWVPTNELTYPRWTAATWLAGMPFPGFYRAKSRDQPPSPNSTKVTRTTPRFFLTTKQLARPNQQGFDDGICVENRCPFLSNN